MRPAFVARLLAWRDLADRRAALCAWASADADSHLRADLALHRTAFLVTPVLTSQICNWIFITLKAVCAEVNATDSVPMWL